MDMGSSSKSWFPFVILIIILGGTIGFFIFGENASNVRQSSIPPKPGCIAMQDNGDYANSIDVVFLPDNYKNVDEFRESTSQMVDAFLQTTPYSESGDMFNFFRIENLNLNLNCDYDYGGDAIVCDPSSAKGAAISCPHDYVMVAVDVDGVQKLFELLRSSAWMGIASLNTDDDPLVFTHEFAHLFADFADEYEYGGDVSWKAPNCDPNWQTCPMFQVVERYDCVKGCVNNQHSRSIKTGIMRDYWKSKVYGDYNEHILRNIIEENTKEDGLVGLQKSMPLSMVEVRFSKGNWDIISVVESEGFPDGKNTGTVGGDIISVLDEDGKIISELSLAKPRLYLDGHDKEGNVKQNVEEIESTIIIALPKTDEDSQIIVKQKDKIVGSYNIKRSSSENIFNYNRKSVEIPLIYSV
jgi:hypothetical protein